MGKISVTSASYFKGMMWLMQLRAIAGLTLIVTITAFGYLQYRKWEQEATRYRKFAEYCGKSQRIYERYAKQYLSEWEAFLSGRSSKESLNLISAAPAGSEGAFVEQGVASSRELAKCWNRLKNIYDRAASFPWAKVPDPLQHPQWEDELTPSDDGAW